MTYKRRPAVYIFQRRDAVGTNPYGEKHEKTIPIIIFANHSI